MTSIQNRVFISGISALLIQAIAYAHNGRDFLLVQTAHIQEQGSVYSVSRQDYVKKNHDEFEFKPALIYGAMDWLALEVHGHIEKESGESATYESTAPAVHLSFTPRAHALGFGLSAEYEFAHDDEEDVVEVSGITSFENEEWITTLTVDYEKASGEDGGYGYGAGVRRAMNSQLALGIEIKGTYSDSTEVLGAIYSDVNDRLTINVGVGVGFNNDVDLAIRTALTWRFN
ncbi:MAG: hypothetical protein GKR87_15785 [Kiritimatiellae bacterium]|nr:hypothetical protein [Kiritimatiellia bacterium]